MMTESLAVKGAGLHILVAVVELAVAGLTIDTVTETMTMTRTKTKTNTMTDMTADMTAGMIADMMIVTTTDTVTGMMRNTIGMKTVGAVRSIATMIGRNDIVLSRTLDPGVELLCRDSYSDL